MRTRKQLEMLLKSQTELADGLFKNCLEWKDKLHRTYMAADKLAEFICNQDPTHIPRIVTDYWQEKSRG